MCIEFQESVKSSSLTGSPCITSCCIQIYNRLRTQSNASFFHPGFLFLFPLFLNSWGPFDRDNPFFTWFHSCCLFCSRLSPPLHCFMYWYSEAVWFWLAGLLLELALSVVSLLSYWNRIGVSSNLTAKLRPPAFCPLQLISHKDSVLSRCVAMLVWNEIEIRLRISMASYFVFESSPPFAVRGAGIQQSGGFISKIFIRFWKIKSVFLHWLFSGVGSMSRNLLANLSSGTFLV